MMRYLPLALSVVALSASADWQRIAVVEIAPQVALAQGIGELGKSTGDGGRTLGWLMMLSENRLQRWLGASREQTHSVAALYADAAKCKDQAMPIAWTILYPIENVTRREFKAFNPGYVEKDGVFKIVDKELVRTRMEASPRIAYAAFSDDDQWAMLSSCEELAKTGFDQVAIAGRELDRSHVRITLGAEELRNLDKFLKAQVDAGRGMWYGLYRSMLADVVSIVVTVRAGMEGVTVDAEQVFRAGSKSALAKLEPLPKNPLAFASGKSLVAVARSNGLPIGGSHELDLEQLGAKLSPTNKTPWMLACSAEMMALTAKLSAREFSLSVKSGSATASPGEILSAILPEAASMNPYHVGYLSPLAMERLGLPVAERVTRDAKMGFADALEWLDKHLPSPGVEGIVYAVAKDGPKSHLRLRISPGEARGYNFFYNLHVFLGMKRADDAELKRQSDAARRKRDKPQ